MTLFFERNRLNPFANLTGILLMAVMMVGLFYVAKGLFWLLAKAAIFFLVGALILHYPTVLGFFKWLWNMLRQNVLQGLVLTALSALLYPVVFTVLFFRALLNRKIARIERSIRTSQQGEFVDFEELESTLQTRKRRVEPAGAMTDDPYKDLFE